MYIENDEISFQALKNNSKDCVDCAFTTLDNICVLDLNKEDNCKDIIFERIFKQKKK